MKQTHWLAIGLALGFMLAVAPGCGSKPTCGPSTCASGCCDMNGTCQPGNVASACGASGVACQVCAASYACNLGFCGMSGTGGGSAGGGTGGGSTTGGGTGGGSTGGGAGGGAGGGGGGAIANADAGVDITFGQTCTVPTACGGTLTGVWQFTNYCQTNFLPSSVLQICPTISATAKGTVRGTVSFTDATPKVASFDVHSVVDVAAFVPPACLTIQGFPIPCSTAQSLIAAQAPGTTCAAADGGIGCNCTFRVTNNDTTIGEYSTSNGVLTVNGGTSQQQTFNYCITGSSLQFKETSSSPKYSGTGTLSLQ